MSTNKNLKFSDYKEVILQSDEAGKEPLLSDLVNNTSVDNNKKVIASIFLIGKYQASDSKFFLILKPKCLWLKIENSTLKDADSSTSIAVFKSYKAGEIIKTSFLSSPALVSTILTAQGVSGVSSIYGLSRCFVYDLNELNRTRSAAISPVGNSNLNNIWL